MANRKKKDIKSALLKKGFIIEDNSRHITFGYCSLSGKRLPIRTMISHSPKYNDLDSNLISAMAKQCKLLKSEFLELIDCPLSREEYEEKLKSQSIQL